MKKLSAQDRLEISRLKAEIRLVSRRLKRELDALSSDRMKAAAYERFLNDTSKRSRE